MQFFHQLKIKLFSTRVGEDEFGNSYFESKDKKRFVVYKGIAEPSKVPADWHCWLHYSTNIAPINIVTQKYSWQKIHLPNLTGTSHAYFPDKNKAQDKKLYNSWKPN